MERSLDLAEAMEARGFSRSPAGARPLRPIVAQTGIAAGLAIILVGATLPVVMPRNTAWPGWIMIAVGVGLLALTLWAMGRGARRERYRRSVWRDRDTALAAMSAGALGFLLAYRFLAPSALTYYPFPSIYWPDFDLLAAAALLGLAAPVIVLAIQAWSQRRTDDARPLQAPNATKRTR
jgi:energy-coupling factor transport system permease protein